MLDSARNMLIIKSFLDPKQLRVRSLATGTEIAPQCSSALAWHKDGGLASWVTYHEGTEGFLPNRAFGRCGDHSDYRRHRHSEPAAFEDGRQRGFGSGCVAQRFHRPGDV